MSIIKLWWHYLIRVFNTKEDHRMCGLFYSFPFRGKYKHKTLHYCSCGYLQTEQVRHFLGEIRFASERGEGRK
jgi:hypothetical protein